jgi:hypothetical protein
MVRGLNSSLMIGQLLATLKSILQPYSGYPMIKMQALIRWGCGMVMIGYGYSPGLDLCKEETLVF